jgi:hypothetical protein
MTMFQNLNRSMTQGETLKIGCSGCLDVDRLSRAAAIARFGPEATPFDLRHQVAKASCRACGTVGLRVWI